MANEEHLEILEQGLEAWRMWRSSNPDVTPDLNVADLSRANLREVDFILADFSRANLGGADFKNATIRATTFADVDLSEV